MEGQRFPTGPLEMGGTSKKIFTQSQLPLDKRFQLPCQMLGIPHLKGKS
jgi:hypothetical protein